MNNFQKMIYEAGYDCRSYSGRGMYGKSCLGVSVNGETTIGVFVADILESISAVEDDEEISLTDQLANAFRVMRTDAMGLGQIFYFPGIAFEEEYNEPSEEDGEAFRGGEAAAYQAEQQAELQRTLK